MTTTIETLKATAMEAYNKHLQEIKRKAQEKEEEEKEFSVYMSILMDNILNEINKKLQDGDCKFSPEGTDAIVFLDSVLVYPCDYLESREYEWYKKYHAIHKEILINEPDDFIKDQIKISVQFKPY